MTRATRNLRKTLDSVAENDETAAFNLMRAVEKLGDEVLRQRLLNTIHRLNQDAYELREARDSVEQVSVKPRLSKIVQDNSLITLACLSTVCR